MQIQEQSELIVTSGGIVSLCFKYDWCSPNCYLLCGIWSGIQRSFVNCMVIMMM